MNLLSMTKLFVGSLPCQIRVRRHAREGKRGRCAFSWRHSLSRASGQPVLTCHYESFKFKNAMKELTFSLSLADHETYVGIRDILSRILLFSCFDLFCVILTSYKRLLNFLIINFTRFTSSVYEYNFCYTREVFFSTTCRNFEIVSKRFSAKWI